MNPPRNKIIPLEIANVIIDQYDATLNIVEESAEIYGKALDGKGLVHFKNGNHYEGEFNNGMFQGKGKFNWQNGVQYTGDFEYNNMTGKGRYDWPDGSWYEGDVQVGLRHGKGVYVSEDCQYEGDWKDGLKDGYGKIVFKSGTVYEGQFQKGLKHGIGKIMYPSGNYYEGEWAFDRKEGKGTMYWESVGEKYTGDWIDNKQDGWGVHVWMEDKSDGKFLRNRYEGEWRKGLRHGLGVFYYSNGSKYEGEWVDNLKEGFAVFTYEDGKVFKGLYKNDKMIPNKEAAKSEEFDLNNSQISPNNQNQPDESILKKQGTTLSVIHENQPLAKKLSTRKTFYQTTSDKNVEPKEPSLITSEVQSNPYDTLLDISDLFVEEDFEQTILEIQEVKNLLLRYHGQMKLWYRNYVAKQSQNSEESFALSAKMFWKMLRDTKVLCPKVTIASFNRLFMQGPKNNFTLSTTFQTLRKKLILGKRDYFEALPENEKEISELVIETMTNEELFENDQKVDVHDENKPLFFRHFADAIIRVAYLKYGGFPDFARKIEQVLVQIQNGLEKRKKPKLQIEEENILIRTRALTENIKDRLQILFQKFPAKEQAFQFETLDYTMTVKKIVDLFEESGLIHEEEERDLVFHLCERAYDPHDSFLPPETARDKSPAAHKTPVDNTQKLGDLLTSEVVYLEFYDIFLLALFSKDGTTVKEEEAKRRVNKALEILEEFTREREGTTRDILQRGPEIQWPYSHKDYMFEHLTTEKEKREREIALLKQKKLEREAEERESKAMTKEDFDIGDEYLSRPVTKQTQSENDEFTESYNEF